MTQWRNTNQSYGLVSILLHWITALAVVGLFGLGLWMVELTYYDKWYNQAPAIHRSVGILLFILVAIRLVWRWITPTPSVLGKTWEQPLARSMHQLLYFVLFTTLLSGYLISTANGRSIEVFNWFVVPATISHLPEQEDIAGEFHKWLAWLLILLSTGHSLAAIKHHFIDRDNTLLRILKPVESPPNNKE